MKSEEYKRGYDAGYRDALREALAQQRVLAAALKGRKLAPRERKPMVLLSENGR